LVGSGGVGSLYFHKPRKPLRISSFFGITAKDQAEITLGLGLDPIDSWDKTNGFCILVGNTTLNSTESAPH